MGTRQAADWVLDLICCGRADGHQGCATWQEADAFRDSYTSGVAVDPHGYSGHGWGHKRAAVLRSAAPREPIGYFDLGGGVSRES